MCQNNVVFHTLSTVGGFINSWMTLCWIQVKKIFIESQVMSKVTKCNTDRIPHAALVITAVHLKSSQEQRNRESPEAEDGLMPNHHPHPAGKIKHS